MTESFILASFQRMGEKPLNVKVMRNKFTGEPAGYCFVHFENDDEAIDAMHKLNGKVIPNTNPPVRFRLNTASNQGKVLMNEREFSLWVGDLTPEVDDYTLYKTFAARYQSIKAAKDWFSVLFFFFLVILDASGFSKGFGFLRFGVEEEQKHCLTHMNGYKGLGTKALKISNAIPKAQRTNPPTTQSGTVSNTGSYPATQDYSHYYDPSAAAYWQNYAAVGGGWGAAPGGGGSGPYYDPSQQGGAAPQAPPPPPVPPTAGYGPPAPHDPNMAATAGATAMMAATTTTQQQYQPPPPDTSLELVGKHGFQLISNYYTY
ncbi:hypothetical protein AAG570_002056 [Ranatra chinensis]|uniref:tRNA selenocysteine-associated protein 1 n=1 Tax=Ranatra chinensis TaxID=642074 RepID=A0ABD0YSW7_9HEMI